MSPPSATIRLASDIGGTFTDLVAYDESTGILSHTKVPSTPPRFESAVIEGISRLGLDGASLAAVVHGSTVVVNTLTERSGQTVSLLTTAGFRDVLEIARGNRPDLYNLRYRKPPPFVERRLRFEVDERMDWQGTPVRRLDPESVRAAARAARDAGATAIAVCLLHSYANPAHELECGRLIEEEVPEIAVTLSHAVTMEWREYERSMTAAMNAYVQAAASGYLDRLSGQLVSAGVLAPLRVMQSNGGTVPADQARAVPIALVESGPVAGVIGAAAVGRESGRPDVISLDIGGTTAKLSLVEGGQVRVTTEYRIDARPDYAGYPIRTPIVDIVEIGAGGGSIVWFDEVGRMAVGPHSAGARPGPACYPEGGSAPTVTDANLITGRLDPAGFLGGRMPLSVERARNAFAPVAKRLGVSIEEAARGSLRITQAAMANALKLISVHRGYDPRRFGLIAMGGGGPLHAAELAAELRIGTVIVPPLPALFSAWGMLTCDGRRDWLRTRVVSASTPEVASVVARVWEELEDTAVRSFEHDGEDVPLILRRYVDARYAGQEHTVKVPAGDAAADAGWVDRTCQEFEREHLQRYGFRLDDEVTFVNFHLTATTPSTMPTRVKAITDSSPVGVARSRVVDFDSLGIHESCVRGRATLAGGDEIVGPAVIEEPTATTLLRPGDRATIDAAGNIVIGVAT